MLETINAQYRRIASKNGLRDSVLSVLKSSWTVKICGQSLKFKNGQSLVKRVSVRFLCLLLRTGMPNEFGQ